MGSNEGLLDMKISGKVAATVLAAMSVANPAQACWTGIEQDAAKVANLNTMMMVSALRCRNGKDNFLTEYNMFVRHNNSLLGAQNAALRSHFARINGAKAADSAMDRFVIGIANNYGAGHDTMGCGQLRQLAVTLSEKGHSAGSLLSLAEASIEKIPLPGGACPVNIASK
jgi:hypothetical protein